MGQKKPNILISCARYNYAKEVYIPYVYGSLRSYAETIPEITDSYNWLPPIYNLENIRSLNALENMVKSLGTIDILGLSCYVWNYQKQLLIAGFVKKHFPHCLIVAGGPHIPKESKEFLLENRFVDIAVHGEGEVTFSEIILENKKKSPNWKKIKGISFLFNDDYVITGESEKLAGPISFPSPYVSNYFQEIMEEIRSDGKTPVVTWETNRGCPYSCSFCDWGSSTMSKIRNFSINRLNDEIEWFSENKINLIKNCDANFGIQEQDLQLSKKLVQENKDKGFPKYFQATYAKSNPRRVFEIAKTFNQQNMIYMGLTVSLQSTDDNVLKASKRKNSRVYDESILQYKKHRIPFYCELILGLPGETGESFRKGLLSLLEKGFDEGIMVYLLQLHPNAQMSSAFSRQNNGLVTKPMRLFLNGPLERKKPENKPETTEIVTQTKNMSTNEMLDSLVFANFIQLFHCSGILRNIAIYFRRRFGVTFDEFYTQSYKFADSNPNLFIGSVVAKLRESMGKVLFGDLENFRGRKKYVLKFDGVEKKYNLFPYSYHWLNIVMNRDAFYQEFSQYLVKQHANYVSDEFEDEFYNLIKFQKEILLTPEYDPNSGKRCEYKYNFWEFFFYEKELKAIPNQVTYEDIRSGTSGCFQLKKNSIKDFLLMVDCLHYPHSFTHQPEFSSYESFGYKDRTGTDNLLS